MVSESEQDILISRFLAGEASPEEAMLLEEMIAASSEAKSSFDKSARIFHLPGEAYFSAATANNWPAIKSTIDNDEHHKAHTGSRYTLLKRWPLVAASVALLITIGILFFPAHKKHTQSLSFHTDALEQRIQLKDSSVIVLAPNSSLNMANDTAQAERRIVLDGAASFSIVHDSLHPLVIEINKLYIKDIGTRFTITPSRDKDTIVVAVQEGKVLVDDSLGSKANIFPSESAVYIGSIKKLTINKPGMVLQPAEKKWEENIPFASHKQHQPETRLNKNDSAPGTVVIECSKCASKAQLEFVPLKDSVGVTTNFMFLTSGKPGVRQHSQSLLPGEYNWFYRDDLGLQTNGRIIVLAAQTKKIMLFGN